MCLEYFWVVKCQKWDIFRDVSDNECQARYLFLSSWCWAPSLWSVPSPMIPHGPTVLVRGIWPSAASAEKSWNVQTLTLRTLGQMKIVRAKRIVSMWCFYVFLKSETRKVRERGQGRPQNGVQKYRKNIGFGASLLDGAKPWPHWILATERSGSYGLRVGAMFSRRKLVPPKPTWKAVQYIASMHLAWHLYAKIPTCKSKSESHKDLDYPLYYPW